MSVGVRVWMLEDMHECRCESASVRVLVLEDRHE